MGDEPVKHQKIEPAFVERVPCVSRAIDDGLPPKVEGRVQDHRYPGGVMERGDEFVAVGCFVVDHL